MGEGQRPGGPQSRDPGKKGMHAENGGRDSKPTQIYCWQRVVFQEKQYGERKEKECGPETQRPGGTSRKIMRKDKIGGIEMGGGE